MVERRDSLNVVTWESKRFNFTSGRWSSSTHFFEDDEFVRAKTRWGDDVWIVGYVDEIPLPCPYSNATHIGGEIMVFDENKRELSGVHKTAIVWKENRNR